MSRFPSPAIALARIALVMLALVVAPGVGPSHAQTYRTSAEYAILMDAATGSVLLHHNADEQMSPASMVKIMTAEIVFREIAEGRLSLDSTMMVSENAWRTGGAMARGSTMFAELNSQIKVSDLLRGLIIQSGNDAAIVLAEGIAGSDEAFADLMTKRARELGLRDTVFKNSWGAYHAEQKTTARDLALLSRHVINTYPDLYKIFGETDFSWNNIRQTNRNSLLTMNIGADGLKTGNIADSGFGLAGSAVRDEHRLIVVVNGHKTARERGEEARRMLTWGFRNFEPRDIFKAGEIIGAASVYGGNMGRVPLVSDGPVRLLAPRGSQERMIGRIEYHGPLIAPIEKGRRVARLRIYRGEALTLDQPLYTAEEVTVGSLPSRAFDAALEAVVGVFRTHVLKAQ